MNCAGDFFGVFGTYALSSALSYCVGSGVNVAMAGGSFGAGFVGNAHGVASTGFYSEFATGAASGFTSAFITGAGTSWINGSSFADGLLNGLKDGAMNSIIEGIICGIGGGLDALSKHANFFTGRAKIDLNGAYSICGIDGLPDMGAMEIPAVPVGKFEGVSVFESSYLGNIKGAHSGATVPGYGIIVGKGVFTSAGWDEAMLQHEFGHILQFRKFPISYYRVVVPESLASCTYARIKGDLSLHWNYWTETWANYLSESYFGKKWKGSLPSYPVANISSSNLSKMKQFNTGVFPGFIRIK